MEPRREQTTVDLAELERAMLQRACWHEDPAAYRQGVHDTLEQLRRAGVRAGHATPDTVAV